MSNAPKKPFTYVVLRYMHDVGTCEFINVGVVICSNSGPQVKARIRTTFGRVKGAFPTLDTEAFRIRMRLIQARFNNFDSDLYLGRTDHSSISTIIHTVIPADDSSLQWSPVGSGITSGIHKELDKLYSRYVTKFDHDVSTNVRNDDDVWRNFKTAFESRNVMHHLVPKDIKVTDDSIHFEHAWKNGSWNCYEPLSFDLASANSIRDKAVRWLGNINSVQASMDAFEVYFLVGKPSNIELYSAYEKALSILKKAPATKVVEESEADNFSYLVASAIEEHEAKQI